MLYLGCKIGNYNWGKLEIEISSKHFLRNRYSKVALAQLYDILTKTAKSINITKLLRALGHIGHSSARMILLGTCAYSTRGSYI